MRKGTEGIPNLVAHISLGLFPAAVLAVVYLDLRRDVMGGRANQLFRLLVAATFFSIVLEMLSWIPDGRAFPGSTVLLHLAMSGYLVAAGIVPVAWMLYAVIKLYGPGALRRFKPVGGAMAVTCAVYLAVILTNPFTGLLFTVDDHVYHRGVVGFLPYALVVACMSIGAAASLVMRPSASRREGKKERNYLVGSALLPAMGAVVQLVWFSWWLVWPLTAVAIVLMYLYLQSAQITTDSLTGLANRRKLDQELAIKWKRERHTGSWCLVMIDVDDFKSINDSFGHAVGDEVLCLTADVLREVFAGKNAVLARYGGDEFAVMFDCDDLDQMFDVIALLQEEIASPQRSLPCSFALSAGGVLCDPTVQERVEDMVSAADWVMYQNKLADRGKRRSSTEALPR